MATLKQFIITILSRNSEMSARELHAYVIHNPDFKDVAKKDINSILYKGRGGEFYQNKDKVPKWGLMSDLEEKAPQVDQPMEVLRLFLKKGDIAEFEKWRPVISAFGDVPADMEKWQETFDAVKHRVEAILGLTMESIGE